MSQISTIFKAHYILEHYGSENQLLKTIEEMAELNREIVNVLTNKPSEIEEEIADVSVMLLQLRILLDGDRIEKIMEEKLDRQMERIAAEDTDKNVEHDPETEEEATPIAELTEEEIADFTKAFEDGLASGIPEGGMKSE